MPNADTNVKTMFNVWFEDANKAFETLVDDVNATVTKMRASGMSDANIHETLMKRLGDTTEEFQSFRGWIKGGTTKLIHGTTQTESNNYPKQVKLVWVLDPTAKEHCETCLANSKMEPKTIDEWQVIGLPAAGATVCDGYCKCTLNEVRSAEPNPKPEPTTQPTPVEPVTPTGEFRPVKTVEDGEKVAKAMGVKKPNYKNMPVEFVNNVNDALSRFPKRLRALSGSGVNLMPAVVTDAKAAFVASGRAKPTRPLESFYGIHINTPTLYEGGRPVVENGNMVGGHIIGINTHTNKTIGDITAKKMLYNSKYEARFGKKWFFNELGESTAHHEVGHLVQSHLLDNQADKWKLVASEWRQRFGGNKYDNLGSDNEAFAEAWSSFQRGEKSRLPKTVVDFMEGIL